MRKGHRAQEIRAKLAATYPEAHCELDYRTPFELLVATILSAQCTDKRVNLVTAELFRHRYAPEHFVNAPPGQLEEEIRSTGFYRNKAKSLRAASAAILEKHGGEVPRTLAELAALPGVGRKTANVVLGNAFGIDEGVVVDTHVSRLSQRLGLTRQKTPEKIELDLMRMFDRNDWTDLSHWLIWHGRRRCMARNPDCDHCELLDLCPSGPKLLKAAAAKKAGKPQPALPRRTAATSARKSTSRRTSSNGRSGRNPASGSRSQISSN